VDHEEYDTDEVANSVSQQGAIPFIIKILDMHSANVGVGEQALAVLCLLASCHGMLHCCGAVTFAPEAVGYFVEEDRCEVVNYGGISVALSVLRAQPRHSGIQEQGLMLLAIIARHRTNRETCDFDVLLDHRFLCAIDAWQGRMQPPFGSRKATMSPTQFSSICRTPSALLNLPILC
jgi:hypothetical protein